MFVNKNYIQNDSQTEGTVSEISDGLLFLHNQMSENTKNTLLTTSFLYGLIDILNEKGIITIEELDEKKREIAQRLVQRHAKSGLGLMYQSTEIDKYTFDKESCVSCTEKLSQCKALCCKIPFALSRQDVEEGIVRWTFGRPYAIRHDNEGYCVHLDKDTLCCTIHDNRPIPCRGFDCRTSDQWKVWIDYEQGIVDPAIEAKIAESSKICYGNCRKELLE